MSFLCILKKFESAVGTLLWVVYGSLMHSVALHLIVIKPRTGVRMWTCDRLLRHPLFRWIQTVSESFFVFFIFLENAHLLCMPFAALPWIAHFVTPGRNHKLVLSVTEQLHRTPFSGLMANSRSAKQSCGKWRPCGTLVRTYCPRLLSQPTAFLRLGDTHTLRDCD